MDQEQIEKKTALLTQLVATYSKRWEAINRLAGMAEDNPERERVKDHIALYDVIIERLERVTGTIASHA